MQINIEAFPSLSSDSFIILLDRYLLFSGGKIFAHTPIYHTKKVPLFVNFTEEFTMLQVVLTHSEHFLSRRVYYTAELRVGSLQLFVSRSQLLN